MMSSFVNLKFDVKRFSVFVLSFFVLIFGFQNCAEESLPEGLSSPASLIEGNQCLVEKYTGTATCQTAVLTYSFSDMPVTNENPEPLNITVPDGCTTMNVKLWGAGGGALSNNLIGGSGAQAIGKIPVFPGETLSVIVGEGGKKDGKATFGGGGSSGSVGGFTAGGASGGGRSAIQRSGYDIVAAGGGGGAGASGGGGFSGAKLNKEGSVINVSNYVQGGLGATTGSIGISASAGAGGKGSSSNGDGLSGIRGFGGAGGSGNPGSGGGGGGYFGGGGGGSSGMTSPSLTFAAGGGGGGSYAGCGNITLHGLDEADLTKNSDNSFRAIFGYESVQPVQASCLSTPSRGGGTGATYTSKDFPSSCGGGWCQDPVSRLNSCPTGFTKISCWVTSTSNWGASFTCSCNGMVTMCLSETNANNLNGNNGLVIIEWGP